MAEEASGEGDSLGRVLSRQCFPSTLEGALGKGVKLPFLTQGICDLRASADCSQESLGSLKREHWERRSVWRRGGDTAAKQTERGKGSARARIKPDEPV